MERIGILVVSYGSRGAALIDKFKQSRDYDVDLYIADKQRNPFNIRLAKEHIVIPSLSVDEICKFVEKHRAKIDFGVVGPEKPIIEGVRDAIEKRTSIPIICPVREFAIEVSKIAQRKLFEEIVPDVNPRFRIFNPAEKPSQSLLKRDLNNWLDELNDKVVVKPDLPAAGKGVGVWGDHFNTRRQFFDFFFSNYEAGAVIIEEKLEGEESSFQAFCDGKHLVPLPETRDYKRAFDGDLGPNTGGMGSYKDAAEYLPFMNRVDWEKERSIVEKIFLKLRGKSSNIGLWGIPFYEAFIHTKDGPMILENNSRGGDPEIQNLIPLIRDDFVDLCFRIIEGNLTHVKIEPKASVVTYKVPPTYGGFINTYPELVETENIGSPINLREAEKLASEYPDSLRVYPGSMEFRNGQIHALESRAVCAVGIAESIEEAREMSIKGLEGIKGGALWYRNDIASKANITRSIDHMKDLVNQL